MQSMVLRVGIIGFIICLSVIAATGQVTKQSSVCVTSSTPNLHLQCSVDEKIHVQSFTYEKTSPDCSPLPPSQQCGVTQETRRSSHSTVCEEVTPPDCQALRQKGRDAFTTSCNGRSSCWQSLSEYWMVEQCGKSNFSVTVSYECIPDNTMNVCYGVNVAPQVDTIYLASPNFLTPAIHGPQNPCSCDVEGYGLAVEILELYFIQRRGERSNLTLTTDRTVWRSGDHKPVAYNDIIAENSKMLKFSFDSKQLYGQVFWVRVKGFVTKVMCNGDPQTTKETRTLPTGAVSGTGSSNTDLTIGPLIITVIILLLVIVILLLLVYIVYRGRPKRPSNYSIHSLEDSGVSYIKFDYISNSSLPEDCGGKNTYDVPSLAGTDDIVHSGPAEPTRSRRANPDNQKGAPKARSDVGTGTSVDVDWEERSVDMEEMQRSRVSPHCFMLQRD